MLCALVLLVGAAVRVGCAREFTDVQYDLLPELFHLDSYDACLAQPGGLYCTGTFGLTTDKPSPIYDLIQEYSSLPKNFNRKKLHRGYCVTRRCLSDERNTTWRFERCVQEDVMGATGLRAALETYHCSSRAPERPPDEPERAFLGAVMLVLFFNFLGTLYDLITHGEGKSKLVMAWSVRSNWRRLTATYEDGDKRLLALAPMQGVRCTMLLTVIVAHTIYITYGLYLTNPFYYEKIVENPLTMLLRNGSSMIQLFVVLSNFLFAYGLLIYSKEHQQRLIDLPLRLLNRIIRLSPIHLGCVAFAATWWPRLGDGPQWESMVRAESEVCRRKFWYHALYLHNFFDSDSHCLVQTWYFAVDFQLYVVASILLLVIQKKKWRPIPVLCLLFMLSSILNVILAYFFEWKVLLQITTAENLRSVFKGVHSFNDYYIKPWGSLPACFAGLLLAHVHHDVQQSGYELRKNKVFMWLYNWSITLLFSWIFIGWLFQDHTSTLFSALYVGVERPVFALIVSIFFLGSFNGIDGFYKRITDWRGWQVSSRLMLSMVSIHWCVNMMGVASKRAPTEVSIFAIGGDALSTLFWTYWLAIPMTVLVEYPFIKSFSALLS